MLLSASPWLGGFTRLFPRDESMVLCSNTQIAHHTMELQQSAGELRGNNGNFYTTQKLAIFTPLFKSRHPSTAQVATIAGYPSVVSLQIQSIQYN